jgi:hypothetical protein
MTQQCGQKKKAIINLGFAARKEPPQITFVIKRLMQVVLDLREARGVASAPLARPAPPGLRPIVAGRARSTTACVVARPRAFVPLPSN